MSYKIRESEVGFERPALAGVYDLSFYKMSAGFRISPALWDKIHHFASFPQTGGRVSSLPLIWVADCFSSLVAANGTVRTKPESRNSSESKPVLVR